MNREFLEHYERELKILYERTAEFAEEFPGIAERLGGLTEEKMDPGLAGLLEGSAYLAARVQLKLKSEFAEFTTNLLEQLLPNYLAPTPSAMMVQAKPNFEDSNLAEGLHFPPGSYVDAVYVEQERRVACRYRLSAPLTIWSLSIEKAEYYAAAAPIQALGLEVAPGTVAGLRLNFHRRTTQPEDDKDDVPLPGAPVKEIEADEFPVYLTGNQIDTITLYEQLFANCTRITVRYLDEFGDPKFIATEPETLGQTGFREDEQLFPGDDRVFPGFALLREFFIFPQKFNGFRLKKLRRILSRISAHSFDVIFEFNTAIARLAPVVNKSMFALHAVPALNLFEMNCARIPMRTSEHEHHVVPDRSRWLDYEAHRIIDVHAHYPGAKEKVRVFPIYNLPTGTMRASEAMYYSFRRLPRRKTSQERRFGTQTTYTGSEIFLSLSEPADLDSEDRVRELSVRALCSNRHLTDQLPIGEAGADFNLLDDTSIPLVCIAGPTPPNDSLVQLERKDREATPAGETLWRLINMLSFNHLGLTDRGSDDPASGLRELLSIFADLSDTITEKRIRGIVGIKSRPIVRRLRQANGFNAARGIEVTITFDEKAFEGSGIMLLGAVLDRFMAEYTSMNSFTQTVIESKKRGVIMRWPPRSGSGRLL